MSDLIKQLVRQPVFLKSTFFLFFIFSCAMFSMHLSLDHYFPIKKVEIIGANRSDQADIKSLLLPLVEHGFFKVNVTEIHDRLAQMPWIQDIAVRRDWPNKIEVNIIEKNALAKWGRDALLSTTGELFAPKLQSYPDHLPLFVGPLGKQLDMLQFYTALNRVIEPIHAKIAYLMLSPYATWYFSLDNGINIEAGHKDILTRLQQFVRVYPKIIGDRVNEVESVDLRYANGVAVRWKNITTTLSQQHNS